MAFTLALQEDLNVVLCPEEASAFAFALAFSFANVPSKMPSELPHRFPGESSPVSLGIPVGHVDGVGSGSICYAGYIGPGNILGSTV